MIEWTEMKQVPPMMKQDIYLLSRDGAVIAGRPDFTIASGILEMMIRRGIHRMSHVNSFYTIDLLYADTLPRSHILWSPIAFISKRFP